MSNGNKDNTEWLRSIGNDQDSWVTQELCKSTWPVPIVQEYIEVRDFARDGNVYAIIWKIRELYETIIKIPIIYSFIYIENIKEKKQLEGNPAYLQLLKMILDVPISMGRLEHIARYLEENQNIFFLPKSLAIILQKTNRLYSEKINKSGINIVNWRNETIGHGAMRRPDDSKYSIEIRKIINLLKKYFYNAKEKILYELYETVYLLIDNALFQGTNNIFVNEKSKIILHIDSFVLDINHFIQQNQIFDNTQKSIYKLFFFDSFFSNKKIAKYTSYTEGYEISQYTDYFSNLYKQYLYTQNSEKQISSYALTASEEKYLECLYDNDSYEKPLFLVESLKSMMEKKKKGIITICMERGTGKSTFAKNLDERYTEYPLIPNITARCYHTINAQIKGFKDFLSSFNTMFEEKYNFERFFRFVDDSKVLLTTETKNVAEALNVYHSYLFKEFGRSQTMLIIDGIDELTEDTSRILDLIPTEDEMDEGTFVLLLTRFPNDETINGTSINYVEFAIRKANNIFIGYKRTDENYKRFFQKYVKASLKRKGIISYDLTTILKISDYRFLTFKLVLPLYIQKTDLIKNENDNINNKIVDSFLSHLLLSYPSDQIKRIKFILLTISIRHSISIKQICEILGYEITYGFIGIINDLQPLLTTFHKFGENFYEFANLDYSKYILESYSNLKNQLFFIYLNNLKNLLFTFSLQDDDKKSAFFLTNIDTFETLFSFYKSIKNVEDNVKDIIEKKSFYLYERVGIRLIISFFNFLMHYRPKGMSLLFSYIWNSFNSIFEDLKSFVFSRAVKGDYLFVCEVERFLQSSYYSILFDYNDELFYSLENKTNDLKEFTCLHNFFLRVWFERFLSFKPVLPPDKQDFLPEIDDSDYNRKYTEGLEQYNKALKNWKDQYPEEKNGWNFQKLSDESFIEIMQSWLNKKYISEETISYIRKQILKTLNKNNPGNEIIWDYHEKLKKYLINTLSINDCDIENERLLTSDTECVRTKHGFPLGFIDFIKSKSDSIWYMSHLTDCSIDGYFFTPNMKALIAGNINEDERNELLSLVRNTVLKYMNDDFYTQQSFYSLKDYLWAYDDLISFEAVYQLTYPSDNIFLDFIKNNDELLLYEIKESINNFSVITDIYELVAKIILLIQRSFYKKEFVNCQMKCNQLMQAIHELLSKLKHEAFYFIKDLEDELNRLATYFAYLSNADACIPSCESDFYILNLRYFKEEQEFIRFPKFAYHGYEKSYVIEEIESSLFPKLSHVEVPCILDKNELDDNYLPFEGRHGKIYWIRNDS